MPVLSSSLPWFSSRPSLNAHTSCGYWAITWARQRGVRHDRDLLLQNDARERIELADPGLAFQHRFGVAIAGVPALHDAGRAEVDVLGVVLPGQLRGEQPHHMHPRRAAIARQFLHR